jgi:hypothetical protein
MRLVTSSTASGYKPALGLEGEQMLNENPFGTEHQDHFATMRFSEDDHEIVNMTVNYWPISQTGTEPSQEPANTFEFKLK